MRRVRHDRQPAPARGDAGRRPDRGGQRPDRAQGAVSDRALLHLAGAFTWSAPQASGGAVQVAPAAGRTGEWTISAVAPGTAALSATGRPPCASGAMCPQVVRAFSLTVVVG